MFALSGTPFRRAGWPGSCPEGPRCGGRGGKVAKRPLALAGGVARWPRGPHSGGRGGGQPKDRLSAREQPTTPSRQMATPNGQDVHISRGIRPLPPIPIGWRRGWRGEKKLDSRVLLALRQFARLAGRADADPRMSCLCVCKTCRRRAIHFGKPCTRSLLVAALRGEPGRVSAPFRFNDAPRAGGAKIEETKRPLGSSYQQRPSAGFFRKGYVPCCQI